MLLFYFLFSFSKQYNADNLLCFFISFWHINTRSQSKIIYFLLDFISEFWTKLLYKFDFTVVENHEGFFYYNYLPYWRTPWKHIKKAPVNIETEYWGMKFHIGIFPIVGYWFLGPIWFFFFFFFITHHFSLNFRHSSLKIPQSPQPHPFGTYFQLLITQNFLLFVGPIAWAHVSEYS